MATPLTFEEAFDRLLGHEGGYVNDPTDPGGETNWGISKRAFPYLDIKSLSRDDAKRIYEKYYWTPLADAHAAIKFQVFDFAVNSGIQTAIRKLQQAIKVADDGHFGPRSLEALKAMDHNDVLMRVNGLRLRFMTDLKNWPNASKGWARRVADNLLYAAEDN